MPRRIQIAVIGHGRPSAEVEAWAEEVGERIAECGAIVVCGGLGGVMAAAARSAAWRQGTSVGILPGYDPRSAAQDLSVVIPTGLGHARNVLVVASGDAVVALPGASGTLSEIGLALTIEKPVVAVRAWSHIEGVHVADTPRQAVDTALRLAGRGA